MNRERLTILRDHLASLPDERVTMTTYFTNDGEDVPGYENVADIKDHSCGTAACIAGWTALLFDRSGAVFSTDDRAIEALDLGFDQAEELFRPRGWTSGRLTRSAAIAAIQSMLDSADDDAIPVWPEVVS